MVIPTDSCLAASFVAAAILVVAALTAHLVPDVVFPRDDGNSWTMSWYSTFLTSVRVDTPVVAGGGMVSVEPVEPESNLHPVSIEYTFRRHNSSRQ